MRPGRRLRPRRTGWRGPRPIAAGDDASLAVRLVREARREGPPPGASGRALAALGVTVAVGTAAAVTAATTTTTQIVAAPVGAAAAPGVIAGGAASTGALAWIAAGTTVVALTIGGAAALVRETAPATAVTPTVDTSKPYPSSPRFAVTDAAPSAEPTAEEAAATPSASPVQREEGSAATPRPVEGTASGTERRPSPPRPGTISDVEGVPPASSTPPSPHSPLAREVALVEGARAALDGGDARRAILLLDRHAAEFSTAVLGPEAARLRARAAAALASSP